MTGIFHQDIGQPSQRRSTSPVADAQGSRIASLLRAAPDVLNLKQAQEYSPGIRN